MNVFSLPAIHSPSTLVHRRSRAYISHHSAPYPTVTYEDTTILCYEPLSTHKRLPTDRPLSSPFDTTTFYFVIHSKLAIGYQHNTAVNLSLSRGPSRRMVHEDLRHVVDAVMGGLRWDV